MCTHMCPHICDRKSNPPETNLILIHLALKQVQTVTRNSRLARSGTQALLAASRSSAATFVGLYGFNEHAAQQRARIPALQRWYGLGTLGESNDSTAHSCLSSIRSPRDRIGSGVRSRCWKQTRLRNVRRVSSRPNIAHARVPRQGVLYQPGMAARPISHLMNRPGAIG